MNTTKKLTTGFALIFAGALALSACSSDAETPAKTSAAPTPAMSETPMTSRLAHRHGDGPLRKPRWRRLR